MRPNNRQQPPLCRRRDKEKETARESSSSSVRPKEDEEPVGKYNFPSAPLPQTGQHQTIKRHGMKGCVGGQGRYVIDCSPPIVYKDVYKGGIKSNSKISHSLYSIRDRVLYMIRSSSR